MDHKEYNEYWRNIGFREDNVSDPKERMLVRHIMALWDRIDLLLDPDTHDELHGRECRCHLVQCACAYDFPDAVCMFHMKGASDADSV